MYEQTDVVAIGVFRVVVIACLFNGDVDTQELLVLIFSTRYFAFFWEEVVMEGLEGGVCCVA